jgi:hypothetical protein
MNDRTGPSSADEVARELALHKVYTYLLQLAAQKGAAERNNQTPDDGPEKAEVDRD